VVDVETERAIPLLFSLLAHICQPLWLDFTKTFSAFPRDLDRDTTSCIDDTLVDVVRILIVVGGICLGLGWMGGKIRHAFAHFEGWTLLGVGFGNDDEAIMRVHSN